MLSKKSFLLNKLWVGLLALTSAHTMVNGDPANTISFAGVEFRIIKSGESDHRFIWLHGDEKTAEMALEYHIQQINGEQGKKIDDQNCVCYISTSLVL